MIAVHEAVFSQWVGEHGDAGDAWRDAALRHGVVIVSEVKNAKK